MKALIVDGEEIYRLSMKEVVSVAANFDEIVEANCEHDFVTTTASHNNFDLIILQPASLDNGGDNCLKLVRRLYPKATIISIGQSNFSRSIHAPHITSVARTVSVRDMITVLRKALKLPVDSYNGGLKRPDASRVQKSLRSEFDQFRHSVQRNEINGEHKPVDLKRLSHRQREILSMAADGHPNKEIAARLDIAEGTVKAHMHSIFKVLGVSNRTQAVIRYGASGGRTESQTKSMPRTPGADHTGWQAGSIA